MSPRHCHDVDCYAYHWRRVMIRREREKPAQVACPHCGAPLPARDVTRLGWQCQECQTYGVPEDLHVAKGDSDAS